MIILQAKQNTEAKQASVTTFAASAPAAQQVSSDPLLVRCAVEVNRRGWLTFRDEQLGFQFQYPPSYTLEKRPDRLVLAAADGSGALSHYPIVLRRFRGAVTPHISPGMEQAGWKIADRQTFAFQSPYVTGNDPDTFTSNELFIRNFPFEKSGQYIMVQADIAESRKSGAFAKALRAGLSDVQGTLTESEQILSTFRFLQFDEYSSPPAE